MSFNEAITESLNSTYLDIDIVPFRFPYDDSLVGGIRLEIEHPGFTLELAWHILIRVLWANSVRFRDHQVLQCIFRQLCCKLCKLNNTSRKSLGKIWVCREKILRCHIGLGRASVMLTNLKLSAEYTIWYESLQELFFLPGIQSLRAISQYLFDTLEELCVVLADP